MSPRWILRVRAFALALSLALCGTAVAAAQGRPSPGAPPPHVVERWSSMTAAERDVMRERFERFKQLDDEARAALHERHASLRASIDASLGELDASERAELEALEPREREHVARDFYFATRRFEAGARGGERDGRRAMLERLEMVPPELRPQILERTCSRLEHGLAERAGGPWGGPGLGLPSEALDALRELPPERRIERLRDHVEGHFRGSAPQHPPEHAPGHPGGPFRERRGGGPGPPPGPPGAAGPDGPEHHGPEGGGRGHGNPRAGDERGGHARRDRDPGHEPGRRRWRFGFDVSAPAEIPGLDRALAERLIEAARPRLGDALQVRGLGWPERGERVDELVRARLLGSLAPGEEAAAPALRSEPMPALIAALRERVEMPPAEGLPDPNAR